MGYWFVLFILSAGTPTTVTLYTYEEQRCLNIASEHLEVQDAYTEVLYIGCVQGSPPR